MWNFPSPPFLQSLKQKKNKFFRFFPFHAIILSMKNRSNFFPGLDWIIGIVIIILVVVVSSAGFLAKPENLIYDSFLHLNPGREEVDDLVILKIDDPSISAMGEWPWTRDIIADGLVRLKELGARLAVFDIEYLSPAGKTLNRNYFEEGFRFSLNGVYDEISAGIHEFTGALASGSFPVSESAEGAEYLDSQVLIPALSRLNAEVSENAVKDNDLYFAESLYYFQNAFLTVNTQDVNSISPDVDSTAFVKENFFLKNIEDVGGYTLKDNLSYLKSLGATPGLTPAVTPLIYGARGVGFPNVVVDQDGVRRRIELMFNSEGFYFGQLVFAPVIYELSPEKIQRTRHSINITNGKLSDGTEVSFKIPLDSRGHMLIKWIPDSFQDSFRSESYYMIEQLDLWEESILSHLEAISGFKIGTSKGYVSCVEAAQWLLEEYGNICAYKDLLISGEETDYSTYFSMRDDFFDNIEFLNDRQYVDEIISVLGILRENAGDDSLYKDVEQSVVNRFSALDEDLENYKLELQRLKDFFNNAFVIIGNTASATTDLGVTPFEKSYPNVGTHANIYNCLMSRQFIYPVSVYVSVILTVVFSACILFLFHGMKKFLKKIIAGLVFILVVILIPVSAFCFFDVYIQASGIYLSTILVFISQTLIALLITEKDKNFLRKAFSTYLPDSVISEIVKNPEKLSLGGEEKRITALFTDIKSFSTFSEKLSPVDLVTILNRYLTVMSNVILEKMGTVDKYIGDAIVSFFGAPVSLENHAASAVSSAIEMKKQEDILNEALLKEGLLSEPIKTRIGINTGSMVVGNMGTDSKMNYTVMGNDVNLASRLEGTNKIYGTWIMASESTVNEAGPEFLVRRLDRVRVMGISTPVQLYEILGYKSEVSGDKESLVDTFHIALDLYLSGKFREAGAMFSGLYKNYGDLPSKTYMERCSGFIKNPPPAGWDGVYNMTSK